jgi:tetratricopeptide (TPR) repeat protein
MRDKTLDQVPSAAVKLYQCGLAALNQGDPASAIPSFITALDMEPGFVCCRQALRDAQKKVEEKRGLWKRICRKGCLSPSLTEAKFLLHLRPHQTIALAERVLNHDPDNVTAHKLLAKAALAADLPHTALLSLETLAARRPGNRSIRLGLAEGCAKSGDVSAAVGMYGHLLKERPEDKKVWHMINMVANGTFMKQTLVPGEVNANKKCPTRTESWQIPPPRPVLKQIEPALTDDATINRLERLVVHCPKNTNVIIKLAEAYAQKLMFDKSLSLYQRASEITGGKNPAIETAIEETTRKKIATPVPSSIIGTGIRDYCTASNVTATGVLKRG